MSLARAQIQNYLGTLKEATAPSTNKNLWWLEDVMVAEVQTLRCRIYWVESQISVDWDVNSAHKERLTNQRHLTWCSNTNGVTKRNFITSHVNQALCYLHRKGIILTRLFTASLFKRTWKKKQAKCTYNGVGEGVARRAVHAKQVSCLALMSSSLTILSVHVQRSNKSKRAVNSLCCFYSYSSLYGWRKDVVQRLQQLRS